jgi:hypothetical protein
MLKRNSITRARGTVTEHDLEAIREAMRQGLPWILHQQDRRYNPCAFAREAGDLPSRMSPASSRGLPCYALADLIRRQQR